MEQVAEPSHERAMRFNLSPERRSDTGVVHPPLLACRVPRAQGPTRPRASILPCSWEDGEGLDLGKDTANDRWVEGFQLVAR